MLTHWGPTRTILVLVLMLVAPDAYSAERFDDSQVQHIAYPDWFAETPFLDLEATYSEARNGGKQGLMVLFTTEGCSYCDAFIRRSLGDPQIAGELRSHFSSVGLEIFDDTEMTAPGGEVLRVKAFAENNGAAFSPTIVFFADEGEPVLRLVGYQSPDRFRQVLAYMSGGHYRSQSLREFTSRSASDAAGPVAVRALIDDPLFSAPPHYLDRSHLVADKPLLVIFVQAGCADCDLFAQDVLADEEVRDRLRGFEVVRLDAADDMPVIRPDGRRSSSADWFEQTGFTRLPALLFFDEYGKLVLETDALVLEQRMRNSLDYVLERAYQKGWTYQRFARQRGAERLQDESATP